MKGQHFVHVFGLLVMMITVISSEEVSRRCPFVLPGRETNKQSSLTRCLFLEREYKDNLLPIEAFYPEDLNETPNNNQVSLQLEERPTRPPIRLMAGKRRKQRTRNKKRRRNNVQSPIEDESIKAANGMKSISSVINEGRRFFRRHETFDVTNEVIPYHTGLAAQYGTLTSETIKAMDEQLKVIIAGTNILMRKLQSKIDYIGAEIPFEAYLGVMHQNVMLQQKENTEIVKSDMLAYEDLNWFQTDRSPEKRKVLQVLTWFSNLINDTDVLRDTSINIEDLANIVAASGAAVTDFATFFVAHDYVERSIVDVGILRYPDPVHPFFKLYRIKIFAYRRSFRILATQQNESGIKGDFEAVQFEPRIDILTNMRKEFISRAVSEAESMFDF